MRFTSWVVDNRFYIRGEFVKDHGDVKKGPRYQGPFDELEMVDDTVWYNYIPKHLHADELAIMCFMIFFPWIGQKVEFPKPVSSEVFEAINHPTFTRFKGDIEVLNLEEIGPQPINRADLVNPEDVVISFGGGVDSSALHALFPEATLVHEINVEEEEESVEHHRVIVAMKHHNARKRTPVYWIQTNARYLSKPSGVTNWLCPLIPALLVACDRGKKVVFTGSNIGTMFLKNGKMYSPGHQMKNPAREIMSRHMVPIVQASAHISVATAYRLCNEEGIISDVVFCEAGPDKGPCSKCMKCMRRELVYRALVHKQPGLYDIHALPLKTDVFLEKYNVEWALKRFHHESNSPYTHNFVVARDLMGEDYPIELFPLTAQAPPSSFMFARPEEGDGLFPASTHQHILSRIHERIRPMTEREQITLRTWRA
jgi:hypothetical protein